MVRHFVEMLVAMVVGMVLLDPVWGLVVASDVLARGDVAALVMATDMTAGMSLWLWFRRHPWREVVGMAAAMYAPYLVLLGPFWAGWVSASALLVAGHVLMLPAMALVMWRHRP
ncbi:hypothetical protein [Saccharothrix sp. NRRL B-16314]|uniref:hypothetical protein n=1 Tax=Saccharothrix sp. NRRL B-16314 TaxID=1463825 RepID=UPI001E509443|nr:hypothetical protein [Saccharothrix sp. NRRL B-16314]